MSTLKIILKKLLGSEGQGVGDVVAAVEDGGGLVGHVQAFLAVDKKCQLSRN
jgi:hypothetical protein